MNEWAKVQVRKQANERLVERVTLPRKVSSEYERDRARNYQFDFKNGERTARDTY